MESRDAIGAAAGKRAFCFLFSFHLRQVVHDAFTNEEIFLDRTYFFLPNSCVICHVKSNLCV